MSEDSLYFCYLDESGVDGAMTADGQDVSPVFALAGVIVAAGDVQQMTGKFLDAKRRCFPERFPSAPSPDDIREEIKGASLPGMMRSGDRRQERRASDFLGASFELLDALGVRLVGRVLVKRMNRPREKTGAYIRSLNIIADLFQRFLKTRDARGIIVLDNRNNENARPNPAVSHSFFVGKFGDAQKHPLVAESPMFADSKNHAGIQMADLLCSGLVAPIAAAAYCEHAQSKHVRPENLRLRELFGERMRRMQFRFLDDRKTAGGDWRDSLTVGVPDGGHSGRLLFRPD